MTLASIEDFAHVSGQPVDPAEEDRVVRLLEMASDTVRSYTSQRISRETATQTLRCDGGRIWLPQRPVVEVVAVEVGGQATSYVRCGDTLHIDADVCDVDVTYTYGYDPVPGEIAATVALLAARLAVNGAGVKQESVGSYSVTYASGDAGGLTRREMRTLSRYRHVSVGSVTTPSKWSRT